MTLDALSPSLVFVLMGVFALLLLATSSLSSANAKRPAADPKVRGVSDDQLALFD